MPFRDVPNKMDFPAMERELLQFWKESGAFEELRQLRKAAPSKSFIDGPITANNPMGVHHGWGRTYKDVFHRFWAMHGYQLRYQNGFDCQGLWVEVEVEKEMGFETKKDIEQFGLENFVRKCKARVLRFAAVQTEQSQRLGYWMDWNDPDHLRQLADQLMEDPNQVISVAGPEGLVTGTVEQIVGRLGMHDLGGSYFTFSDENNYMIWTFLKKCWEKGWLYRGVDVMPWCPRCATAISQHEIVTDGYAELTHDSVMVKFPLTGRESMVAEYLLVWTTTPWTLTSNVAAAVGPDLTYVKVKQEDEIFYLSQGTLHMLKGNYQVLDEIKGSEMEGWTYRGPFDELPAVQKPGGFTPVKVADQESEQVSAAGSHQVILWDDVGEAEGTGIVHIAPGCGAEDFELGRQYQLPMVAPLEEEGHFLEGFGWLTGLHVSSVAEPIFADLQHKGLLYTVQPYTHRYPTCWRCKTELVFRLVDEWFIRMGLVYDKPRQELTREEKENSLRYQVMDVVDGIQWIPEFGYAREMDWLRNMHDWMISKKRFWGLALPIWVCEGCEYHQVIGSQEELQQRASAGWETFAGHTPHRPYIDAVQLTCPQCGSVMKRIPDVGNPWLDAGIVPFSTLRYRTDKPYWEKWYPAEWITESFPGQFRNWFYSLLAMATVLERRPPFLQNFGYATLVAEDGRPMHKSWGNSIEFNEAAGQMGVDVMRWLYCTQRPENDLLFGYTRGDEARRAFLIPLWNVYSFFVTYANLDGWQPAPSKGGGGAFDPAYPEGTRPQSENLLDQWVLARLDEATVEVTRSIEASDFVSATAALQALIDDLTNWYVRRSRRRFWKSQADADKEAAYQTLYYVLVRLARILAPFIPFASEAIYQNLVKSVIPAAYGSIHHTSWPVEGLESGDAGSPFKSKEKSLLGLMFLARQVASLGLAARSAANLKVRQPLRKVLAFAGFERSLPEELIEIVRDELNVKEVEFVEDAGQFVTYRILPDNKRLGPRYGSLFPKVRAALASVDPAQVAASVAAGLPVALEVDGESLELSPEDILVNTQPAPGLAVMADKGVTVAIDTALTPELRAEGLAREVVRRVQAMRKEAGFHVEDRIFTYYQTDSDLAEVMVNFAGYICGETLSTQFTASEPPAGAYVEDHSIDGQTIRLGVMKKEL